jgi:transcriptional regulator GlxA family with amidase domain
VLDQFDHRDDYAAVTGGLLGLISQRDPLVAPLAEALLSPDEASRVLSGHYTAAFDAALRRRIGELRRDDRPSGGAVVIQALQKWRLRRVLEHIEANIDQRLSLQQLAQIAGLSRMYFAAQFRSAMKRSPHDYIIQRRVEIAKTMLVETCEPIVNIALSVGFQTQAHFTTVFGRIVGRTPRHWRQNHVGAIPGH